MTRAAVNHVIRVALALVLAVTSLSAAAAHGRTTVGQDVVICSGGAVVTITIGADGQPIKRQDVCPDYALAMFAAVLGGVALPAPRLVASDLQVCEPVLAGRPCAIIRTRARAPPVTV